MKIGYIRFSKQEQNEALQRDALKEAGCEKFFNDAMIGSTFERKGLEEALAFVRPGTYSSSGNWIAWVVPFKISSKRSIFSKSARWISPVSPNRSILERLAES